MRRTATPIDKHPSASDGPKGSNDKGSFDEKGREETSKSIPNSPEQPDKVVNHTPCTLHPEHPEKVVNDTPCTLNQHPEKVNVKTNLNPEPFTLHRQPSTLNPKP